MSLSSIKKSNKTSIKILVYWGSQKHNEVGVVDYQPKIKSNKNGSVDLEAVLPINIIREFEFSFHTWSIQYQMFKNLSFFSLTSLLCACHFATSTVQKALISPFKWSQKPFSTFKGSIILTFKLWNYEKFHQSSKLQNLTIPKMIMHERKNQWTFPKSWILNSTP